MFHFATPGLSKLVELNMVRCNIKILPSDVFTELPNLKVKNLFGITWIIDFVK